MRNIYNIALAVLFLVNIVVVMLVIRPAFLIAHPEIGNKKCLDCHKVHGGRKKPLLK